MDNEEKDKRIRELEDEVENFKSDLSDAEKRITELEKEIDDAVSAIKETADELLKNV